jgi:hypothetical protein
VSSETLTYVQLAERLKTSPEAARALARRLRLPRSRSNEGKTLVKVDLAKIRHRSMPSRAPAGHRQVTAALKTKVTELEAQLADMREQRDRWRALAERLAGSK